MGVVDRTDEFRQILQELQYKGVGAGAGFEKADAAPSQAQSQLNALSAEIGAEIHNTSLKAAELRKMAKAKGIFNDKTNEIQELTYTVKQDIQRLTQKIEGLEKMAKSAGPNKNSQAHSSNMVTTLQTRLLEVTKDLKGALEVRTKALEQQDNRRQMYTFGQGNAANPFGGQQKQPAGNADDLEGGGGQQAMQLQYTQSRAEAVQSVQRTIGELGTMFQKMAVMVTQQEDMIQRIDQDIDETTTNVELGQDHLLKYFHHISSNRMLIIKVFLILIFFVVFFIVFLA